MNPVTKLYYGFRRNLKAIRLYLVLSGPGLVVMIADNDAGGITTYAVTGAKYQYHLIWFLLLLILRPGNDRAPRGRHQTWT
jgi:Mn2+/Fe2+ NRAMP family transporter